jgi:glycosyltransferase involved in cell wall biosynthesis
MTFTKVTIITPTYNRAGLIEETIQSIIDQDYPNLEYLILDDGSTDNTYDVVKPYISKYPSIIKYEYHSNMGEANTVNKGWELATGDYVMVVCSDDPQPKGLIHKSVEYMEKDDGIIVTYPDWKMIDDDGKTISSIKLKDFPYERMVKDLYCFIGPGALINRKVFKGTIPYLRDPRYKYISDFECWLRLGLLGKFKHIPEEIAAWRHHPGAGTVNYLDQMLWQNFLLINEYFDKKDKLPLNIQKLENTAKAKACVFAAKSFIGKSYTNFFKYLLLGFFKNPLVIFKDVYFFIKEKAFLKLYKLYKFIKLKLNRV